MTLSNNIAVYHDCFQIMDAVLTAGAGDYYLVDEKAAQRWCFRCYKARNLHRAERRGKSHYDCITIRKPRYDEGHRKWAIHLTTKAPATGTFIPADGGAAFEPMHGGSTAADIPDITHALELLHDTSSKKPKRFVETDD